MLNARTSKNNKFHKCAPPHNCFGKKVYIKNLMTMHKDEHIYEWGKNLIEFEAKLDISEQISKAVVLTHNAMDKKAYKGEVGAGDVELKIGGRRNWTEASKAGDGHWVHHVYDHSVKDGVEAKEIAQGLMRKRSFKLLRGVVLIYSLPLPGARNEAYGNLQMAHSRGGIHVKELTMWHKLSRVHR